MKVVKILIVMIVATLGFQAHAQRGVFVHESYNSVTKYIHPLDLHHRQVDDWTSLNRFTDAAINEVRRDRRMSQRSQAKKIDRLFDRKDKELRNILSRRQYDKYRNMKGNDRGRSSGNDRNRGNSNNSNYYDQSNSGCPATGSGNYYDGDRNNDSRNNGRGRS